MSLSLEDLKTQRVVWSASQSSQLACNAPSNVPSGFSMFDQKLGGWPSSGLVELQPSASGIGELRLILPALS